MFFAGIYVRENLESFAAVIVEKRLNRARREYLVRDCRVWNGASAPDNPVDAVQAIYEDPRFVQKKKVFSQSRRPPKNTYSRPVIVISVSGRNHNFPDVLRNRSIPVEAVIFHHGDPWVKEDLKIIRFGSNYRLNPGTMAKLIPLFTSPGLVLEDTFDPTGRLLSEIRSCRKLSKGTELFDEAFTLIPALCLALWHAETIRQVKRY